MPQQSVHAWAVGLWAGPDRMTPFAEEFTSWLRLQGHDEADALADGVEQYDSTLVLRSHPDRWLARFDERA